MKNAFELKNARRVLVEGNVFEHVWAAAQAGYAILFSTRNQDGRSPWSVVEDVTFRYNIIRHAANAINVSGYDSDHPSMQGSRYRISHNLVYDIDGATWGGSGIFLQIGNQPRDVVVEHNTVQHTGNVVTVYGKRNGGPAVVDGFIFRDNLMRHNKYGVKGESLPVGSATLDAYFTSHRFERNALAGGKASEYPAGNYFPTIEQFDAAFVSAEQGNFALVPGSPFRNAASDGGPLGADVARLKSIAAGLSAAPAAPPVLLRGTRPPKRSARKAVRCARERPALTARRPPTQASPGSPALRTASRQFQIHTQKFHRQGWRPAGRP